MKQLFLFCSIFIASFTFGQTIKNLKVFCTDKFDTSASITVEQHKYDPCLATDALKNNLVMNGFTVISEVVAREKVELSNKGKTNDTTFNQEISSGKTTYIQSVYLITFNYNQGHKLISDLSGQIVDLVNDGEIVATFSFKQGYNGSKKTSAVMEALAKALKEKSSN
ncbi:hypothetical protein BH10BAC2_BH10BAC2_04160 [soil metagenome]